MFWFFSRFNSSGINFYLVAVHEIGHALGLGHNINRKSIMYPVYGKFPHGSMLPNHDRQSIQAIYGASKVSGGKSKYNCPPGQCSSESGRE